MNQEKFDLVFSGELVPGCELAQVKKNIQQLFRIDAAKVEVLFSGRDIPLKRGLDAETANKYRVAIKKAGARVSLVQSPRDSGPPPQSAASPAAAKPLASSSPDKTSFSTSLGAQSAPARQEQIVVEAPQYELAQAGADMLPREYYLPLAEVEVDISGLSVAPQEGRLVQEEEIARPQPVTVTIPNIDVAPPGSDVLAPHERPRVQAKPIDTSAYSVAQAGERLAAPREKAPAPPNVDHIKLKD